MRLTQAVGGSMTVRQLRKILGNVKDQDLPVKVWLGYSTLKDIESVDLRLDRVDIEIVEEAR